MLTRKLKRMHFFKKFEKSKNDMKKTWQEINCIVGRGNKQSTQFNFKDDFNSVQI